MTDTRSAIVEDGVVTNIIMGEIEGSIPCGDEVAIGWSYASETFTAPDPVETPEASLPEIADYQVAIQKLVDETALSQKFNDGVTLASYYNSTIPAWKDQSRSFVAWRDEVWAYAYAEMDKVMAGERLQPRVAEFLDEIPLIVWPAIG